MKIVITLTDTTDGIVDMVCKPPIPDLIHRYKKSGTTPALVYAVLAIKKLQGESEMVESEIEKKRREDAIMNSGVIIPWKKDKPDGPSEVDFNAPN